MNSTIQLKSRNGKLVATFYYTENFGYPNRSKSSYEITLNGDLISPYCPTPVQEEVFRARMTELVKKFDKLMEELTVPYNKWSENERPASN